MARFLVDASLPRSVGEVIVRMGHEVEDVRDVGLGTATDEEIARHAMAQGMAIVTADFDFADVRHYPPEQYGGILVVDRPSDATVAVVCGMVEKALGQVEVVDHLQGRLVIVDVRRIRIRPALM